MLEDKLLIWKFKRGSRSAFSRIYEKYENYLLTLAGNLNNDAGAAEDVVQDVFVSFIQSIETFRLTGSLKGYLATCTANRCRDYIRKRQRQNTVATDEIDDLKSNKNGPVQSAIENEEVKLLNYAMQQIPYEQRETIALHIHGNLKFKQIARWQRVSIKTAQSRYRYGLEKMRAILDGKVRK